MVCLAFVAAAGEAGRPVPPDGYAKKPVTYVSFAEAENYCRFYGKRLPEAWEFQYFSTVCRPISAVSAM